MTKNEIIEELAKNKVVEEIVENITKNRDSTIKDLIQMLYLDLLEKDEEKIQELYNKNQLTFFITRMAINQFHSNNSPYHYMFRKIKTEPLNE